MSDLSDFDFEMFKEECPDRFRETGDGASHEPLCSAEHGPRFCCVEKCPCVGRTIFALSDMIDIFDADLESSEVELKDLIVNSYLIHEDHEHFIYITIDRCPYEGGVRWAIRNGIDNYTLDKHGKWIYQPLPSSRTETFYQRTRWATPEEALAFWESVREELI